MDQLDRIESPEVDLKLIFDQFAELIWWVEIISFKKIMLKRHIINWSTLNSLHTQQLILDLSQPKH